MIVFFFFFFGNSKHFAVNIFTDHENSVSINPHRRNSGITKSYCASDGSSTDFSFILQQVLTVTLRRTCAIGMLNRDGFGMQKWRDLKHQVRCFFPKLTM